MKGQKNLSFGFWCFLALLLASAETTEGIVSSFELPAEDSVVLWMASSVLKITVVFGDCCVEKCTNWIFFYEIHALVN